MTWKARLDAGTQPPGSDANGWEIKSTNRSGLFKRLKKAPNTAWHHHSVPRRRAFIACPLAEGPHRPAQEVCPSPGDGEGPWPPPPPPLSLQTPAFSRGWSRPRPGPRRHPAHHRSPGPRCPRRLPGALPWSCSQFLETCKYSSDLNVIFFSPLKPLQSKDYLLHTHAAALFSRINRCSPPLPGERTRGCPSGPFSSPGNVAWPRPRPGTARTSRLVSLWLPAPWCPVPPGLSRPWGFCLSG